MPGGTSSTGTQSTSGCGDTQGRRGWRGGSGGKGRRSRDPSHPARPAHPAHVMSLSTVLFFFLAHLGVGIAFTMLFVHREAGVKFFRFNGGLAALLLGIALAFRYQALRIPPMATPQTSALGGMASASDIALFASAG